MYHASRNIRCNVQNSYYPVALTYNCINFILSDQGQKLLVFTKILNRPACQDKSPNLSIGKPGPQENEKNEAWIYVKHYLLEMFLFKNLQIIPFRIFSRKYCLNQNKPNEPTLPTKYIPTFYPPILKKNALCNQGQYYIYFI